MEPHHRLRPPVRARCTSKARKFAGFEAQVGFGICCTRVILPQVRGLDPQGEGLQGEVQIDSFWSKFAANQPRKRDFNAGTLYAFPQI